MPLANIFLATSVIQTVVDEIATSRGCLDIMGEL